MINNIQRGLLSGFFATCILSICMWIKSAAHIVPQANAIQALVKVSTIWLGSPLSPWVGWLEHFFIGTVLWGISFAVLEQLVPPMAADRVASATMKGILFSIGAWIVMMVLLMPPAGAGWFAANLGYGAPLAALVLHVIWGASLGAIYGALTPARASVPQHEAPGLAPRETQAPPASAARSRERDHMRSHQ